jgi:hypothetical protein
LRGWNILLDDEKVRFRGIIERAVSSIYNVARLHLAPKQVNN